ncbi:MAG: ferredoxin reductase [Conexibacter sp.]|jgi:ferredoxin|nr:ferredoxin reductase [Conexibacter sp.]
MKVTIDLSRCEFHGQCVIAAPDVFDLVDETTIVWEREPDESLRADVEAAADVCPTQAIFLEG